MSDEPDGRAKGTWIEIKTESLEPRPRDDVPEEFLEIWDAIETALEWLDTPSADSLPEWATIDEMASLMRMDRKTISDAVKAGQISGRRVGSHYRIHVPTVIESFRRQLDEREPEAESVPKTRPSRRKAKKRRTKATKSNKTEVT